MAKRNTFSVDEKLETPFNIKHLLRAGKYIKRFGGTKVLIHYGGGSVVRSGLLGRVKASLEAEAIPYVELGGVKPNITSYDIEDSTLDVQLEAAKDAAS